jgi:hypothetical protein
VAINDTPSPAANYTDPNPVDPEHVKNLMRSNFPEPAIDWIGRATWQGPVDVPWDRIDDQDEKKWAASHQPGKVNDFVRQLRQNPDQVKPSILIQGHKGDKADVIDGHHRAVAHKKLGTPVRAYLGTVKNSKDAEEALETHSSQYHSGTDPRNKSTETPSLESTPDILGPNGLWHTPDKHVPEKQKLPNYIEHIAHALMRNQGMEESRAIATAINAVKRWAKGDLHWGHGKVHPEVVGASQRAVEEWERLRTSHTGSPAE